MRLFLSLLRNTAIIAVVLVAFTSERAKAAPWCDVYANDEGDACAVCTETTLFCGGAETCTGIACVIDGELFDDGWCDVSYGGGICYA